MTRKPRINITRQIYDSIINMAYGTESFTSKKIANALKLSESAVRNCLTNYQDGKEFVPSKEKRAATIRNRNVQFSQAENIIFNSVSCNNEIIQKEIVHQVSEGCGIKYNQSTISRKLKKLNYTRKRLSLIPEERNSLQNIDKRAIYARNIGHVPLEKLVFIDESGFNQHLRRRYGYARANERAYITVPGNKNSNKSLICAININGVIAHEYRTGAYNAVHFEQFIRTKLHNHFIANPDNILIMDNVPFHKSRSIIAVLNELRINKEYLPPWSPQLNPIEEFFSMIKARFRTIKTENSSQTIEQILQTIFEQLANENMLLTGFWRSMGRWLETARQKLPFN